MPTVYSKFHLYILPTYEKIYRWYEGLDSDSDSETDTKSNENENLLYFKPSACFTYYKSRPENY